MSIGAILCSPLVSIDAIRAAGYELATLEALLPLVSICGIRSGGGRSRCDPWRADAKRARLVG